MSYCCTWHAICTCFSAEREWRCQSQAVQRDLPRPTDVNTSILRGAPHKDQKYRELYKVDPSPILLICSCICLLPLLFHLFSFT